MHPDYFGNADKTRCDCGMLSSNKASEAMLKAAEMLTVTDEMVEAAATELLAHADFTCTGTMAQEKEMAAIAARAALQAALSQSPK